jgi:hypothetical protein
MKRKTRRSSATGTESITMRVYRRNSYTAMGVSAEEDGRKGKRGKV